MAPILSALSVFALELTLETRFESIQTVFKLTSCSIEILGKSLVNAGFWKHTCLERTKASEVVVQGETIKDPPANSTLSNQLSVTKPLFGWRARNAQPWFRAHVFPILLKLVRPVLAAGNSTDTEGEDDGFSGDDFANNLFSDLAPLLSLFGEQVAKQYMSHSTHWLESFIFAMGPLGILTAIVGAIRVSGPSWLKAVIGRAREGVGIVEVELLSSTSTDVSELWNGNGVSRVLGTADPPPVLEIIYFESIPGTTGTPSVAPDVYNFSKAVQEKILVLSEEEASVFQKLLRKVPDSINSLLGHLKGSGLNSDYNDDHDYLLEDFEIESAESGLLIPAPPNLGINLARSNLRRRKLLELYAVACLGLIMQLGVLVFAGFATQSSLKENSKFQKDGKNSTPGHIFPLFVTGTLLLTIGMFVCAQIVEKRTDERTWIPGKDFKGYVPRVAWLQKGTIVNDQQFDSTFIRNKHHYSEALPSEPALRITKSQKSRSDQWELLAALITSLGIIGYILQFIGIRGLSWTVSIAQLGVTGFMTAARAFIRRDLLLSEVASEKIMKGHEVDSAARTMRNCSKWIVIPGSRDDYGPPDGDGTLPNGKKAVIISENATTVSGSLASNVLNTTCKLRKLANWESPCRNAASCLISAIEITMNHCTTSDSGFQMRDPLFDKFRWSITVEATRKNDKADGIKELEMIDFEISRKMRPGGRGFSLWTLGEEQRNQIESVLSQWTHYYKLENRRIDAKLRSRPNARNDASRTGSSSARVIGVTRQIFYNWINRNSKTGCVLNRTDWKRGLEDGTLRIFGAPVPCDKLADETLIVQTTSPLELTIAQIFFSEFFASFARNALVFIKGEFQAREPNLDAEMPLRIDWSNPIRPTSEPINKLTYELESSRLGGFEELLYSIIPPIDAKNLLPTTYSRISSSTLEDIGTKVKEYMQASKPEHADTLLTWCLHDAVDYASGDRVKDFTQTSREEMGERWSERLSVLFLVLRFYDSILVEEENEYTRQAESAIFNICLGNIVESDEFEAHWYAKAHSTNLNNTNYKEEMLRLCCLEENIRLKSMGSTRTRSGHDMDEFCLSYLKVSNNLQHVLQTLGFELENQSLWVRRLHKWHAGIADFYDAAGYSDRSEMRFYFDTTSNPNLFTLSIASFPGEDFDWQWAPLSKRGRKDLSFRLLQTLEVALEAPLSSYSTTTGISSLLHFNTSLSDPEMFWQSLADIKRKRLQSFVEKYHGSSRSLYSLTRARTRARAWYIGNTKEKNFEFRVAAKAAAAGEHGRVLMIIVAFCLREKCVWDFGDRNGRSLLHFATSFGYIEMVRILLVFEIRFLAGNEPGYSPLLNRVDVNGDTALDLAYHANDGALLRLLIFYGANSFVPGRTDTIRRMLEVALETSSGLSSSPVGWPSENFENLARTAMLERESLKEFGRTRFHWAVWLGSCKVVKNILEELGNEPPLLALRTIKMEDREGVTALRFALQGGGRRLWILYHIFEKFPDVFEFAEHLVYELLNQAFQDEKTAAIATFRQRIASELSLKDETSDQSPTERDTGTTTSSTDNLIQDVNRKLLLNSASQNEMSIRFRISILPFEAPITQYLLQRLESATGRTRDSEVLAQNLFLHFAVEIVAKGDLATLEFLIQVFRDRLGFENIDYQLGACFSSSNYPEYTSPLVLAIAKNNPGVVVVLLKKHPKLANRYLFEGPNWFRDTKIGVGGGQHWSTGDLSSTLRCRLEEGHRNLLSFAAEAGNVDMVSYLSISRQSADRPEPDHCRLSIQEDRDRLKLEGSKSDTTDSDSAPLLVGTEATSTKEGLVVRKLKQPQSLATATGLEASFSLVAPAGNSGSCRQLIERFMTPLSFASMLGHTEIVEILLDGREEEEDSLGSLYFFLSADIGKLDGRGRSALSYASQNGHLAVVKILLQHLSDADGDFWVENHRGDPTRRRYGEYEYNHWGDNPIESAVPRSPLSYAAEEGHLDVMRELLGHRYGGATVDARDLDGFTPLLHACIHGRGPAVHLLLENGAQINNIDNSGNTILSRVSQAPVNTQGHFLHQPPSDPNAPAVEYQQFVKEEDPVQVSDPSGNTWKLWDNYPRERMLAFLRAFGATDSVPEPSAEGTMQTTSGHEEVPETISEKEGALQSSSGQEERVQIANGQEETAQTVGGQESGPSTV